ncbi:hypothetical protein J2T08_002593 [Neorhizobium galegae]|nr:hypothetical protein [Neorhizobium galegae]
MGIELVCGIIPDGPYVDEMGASVFAVKQTLAGFMAGNATGIDLSVAKRRAAEHHDQVRMADDLVPWAVAGDQPIGGTDDVRQDDFAGGITIGLDGTNGTTIHVEKAFQLALRMMKSPRARPAVGAGKNRAVAMLVPDAANFSGNQFKCFIPGNLDKCLGSPPPGTITRSLFKEGSPDGWFEDAAWRKPVGWKLPTELNRIGIAGHRTNGAMQAVMSVEPPMGCDMAPICRRLRMLRGFRSLRHLHSTLMPAFLTISL